MPPPGPRLPAGGAGQGARRREPRHPRWRWFALAVVLLLLVALATAWIKQRRAARQVRQPATVERQLLPRAGVVPDRPSRDRPDRPGDTLEALRREAQREFREADRDGDGYLSRAEVAGRFPRIEREFARVDTDGDGRISPQEFFRLRRFQARQHLQK